MKTTNAPTETSTQPASSIGPGRSTTYTPHAVSILLALIREAGLSDSAAAAKAGLSTSSLSRWRREYPDFALALLRAREEFRDTHLQIIITAAKARGGWRASAWILQHVFPGDYSPRAAEREKFQRMAEQQAERNEAEAEAYTSAVQASPPVADATSRDEVNSSPSANLSLADLVLSLHPLSGKDSHNSHPLLITGRITRPGPVAG